MTKQEFLGKLSERLSGLPKKDIEERLSFYDEMISDRMEDGLSEEEAVDGIGTIEECSARIVDEIPLKNIVKERIRPKKKMSGSTIALLIITFPIWMPFLCAAFAVIFSVYASLWALVASLWGVTLSLIVAPLVGVLGTLNLVIRGNLEEGLCIFAFTLIAIGFAILFFRLSLWMTKLLCKGTGRCLKRIKHRLVRGKENEQ